MKCNRCRGPAVDRGPAAQRRVLQGLLHPRLPRAGEARHQAARHGVGRRPHPRRGLRAARTRSPSGTCCSSWGTTPPACTSGWGSGATRTRSGEVTKAFAAERGAELIVVDLERDYGYDIPTAGTKGSRSTCAVCGLSKRYVFNRAALEGGFDVIATGHNLDDEAATLLGNTLRWQTEYIARQSPALPAKDGMVKKVKPLFRLSELETAAYAFLRGIDYIVEECPLVAGNTQLRYKDAMNAIEATSPGTKAAVLPGLPRPRSSPVHAGRRRRAVGVRAVRAADHRPLLRVLSGPGADPGRTTRCGPWRLGELASELVGRGHAGRDLRRSAS